MFRGVGGLAGELRALMLGLALPIEAAVDAERDVDLWMREFDAGGDAKIDKPEFESALSRCGVLSFIFHVPIIYHVPSFILSFIHSSMYPLYISFAY